ncbi:hypothetical protein HK104_005389 [Borealophlyctis nickersoniae]|nr:hypothetical protein HK104_005389 [Borealophlyctis nickersoniae]
MSQEKFVTVREEGDEPGVVMAVPDNWPEMVKRYEEAKNKKIPPEVMRFHTRRDFYISTDLVRPGIFVDGDELVLKRRRNVLVPVQFESGIIGYMAYEDAIRAKALGEGMEAEGWQQLVPVQTKHGYPAYMAYEDAIRAKACEVVTYEGDDETDPFPHEKMRHGLASVLFKCWCTGHMPYEDAVLAKACGDIEDLKSPRPSLHGADGVQQPATPTPPSSSTAADSGAGLRRSARLASKSDRNMDVKTNFMNLL